MSTQNVMPFLHINNEPIKKKIMKTNTFTIAQERKTSENQPNEEGERTL